MTEQDHHGSPAPSPARRTELIAILRELADPALQKRLWVERADFPNVSGIDQVFHFFFDDTDLARDPLSEVGTFLKNENEAECIKLLCNALDAMLVRLGDVSSEAFLNDPSWSSVVGLAKSTLECLETGSAGEYIPP